MDVVGYVFPIKPQHADSIFENKKDVFVKSERGRLKRLSTGSKAIFHVSDKKFLIGEAIIKSIERKPLEKIWKEYGARLFLTKKELREYAKTSPLGEERKTKNLTVYVLTQIKKYRTPRSPNRRMTMAGYYITRKEYDVLKSDH